MNTSAIKFIFIYLVFLLTPSCKNDILYEADNIPTEVFNKKKGNLKISNESLESQVKRLIQETLRVEEEMVTNGAKLIEDLGADELDMKEIRLAMNGEFQIEISPGEAETLRTVMDWVNYVRIKLDPMDSVDSHSVSLLIPNSSLSLPVTISFTCKKSYYRGNNKIVNITDIVATSQPVIEYVYDSSHQLVKTIQAVFAFNTGSWMLLWDTNATVIWKGEFIITVTENGVQKVERRKLSHSAGVLASTNVSVSNTTFEDQDNPSNPGFPTNPTVQESIRSIIAHELGVQIALVVPTASFISDLGSDESEFLNMIQAIQKAFSIIIRNNARERLLTVQQLYDFVSYNINTQQDLTVKERMILIIMDKYDVYESQVLGDVRFEDLGGDELDFIELIHGVQGEFNIIIPDEDRNFQTVQQLYEYLIVHL